MGGIAFSCEYHGGSIIIMTCNVYISSTKTYYTRLQMYRKGLKTSGDAHLSYMLQILNYSFEGPQPLNQITYTQSFLFIYKAPDDA